MSSLPVGRIDYLKFFFKIDHDLFQDMYVPYWNSMLAKVAPVSMMRKTSNITSLGAKPGESGRYIFECWGEDADTLARLIGPQWITRLKRIDYRFEVEEMSGQEIQDAVRYLNFREKKNNTSLFDSKPRHKAGDNRDVGGVGMYWGSRASAQHGVIYKRGTDVPAVEFRLKDKGAETFAWQVTNREVPHHFDGWYASMIDVLHSRAVLFFQSRLGGDIQHALYNAAEQGAMLRKIAGQIGMFDEVPEERAYFQSLTTEEQADLAKATFDVTPRGWAEPTSAHSTTEPIDALPPEDDDVPF